MSVPSAVPAPLQTLFRRMTHISNATPGMKPCFLKMTYVQRSSWLGAIKRWWDGESRNSLGIQIQRIADEATQTLRQYEKTEFWEIILDRIILMRNGIEIIKETYKDSDTVVGELQTALLTLDICIPNNVKKLRGIPLVTGNLTASSPAFRPHSSSIDSVPSMDITKDDMLSEDDEPIRASQRVSTLFGLISN